MIEKRTEYFQGYCPTQDKWEKVEQTFLDVTTQDSEHYEYMPGLMTCPYISFRNGTCNLSKECPLIKGEWTAGNPSVFVALQFNTPDEKPRDIVDAVIKPVCNEFGLVAFTVSDIEHNECIYDVILKSISKSSFIIADLTYHNCGAYYEAGYAKGQGKKVIHACSREWFSTHKVHFDVSGLNLIIYNDAEEFKEKLRIRIRETCI